MQSLPIITPDWPVPSHVKALTTTVSGGVSGGDYAGLNLGGHVGDDVACVRENRRRLQAYVGKDVRLCWLKQTHSDIIVDLARYHGVVEGDAAVTNKQNTACLVMTADCLPVLLCNQNGTKVAALHCGWKGLYQHLINKVLHRYFADDVVTAWLGPSIGQASYEVDEALYRRFIKRNPAYRSAFMANRAGHYLFALTVIARQQLQDNGVMREKIFGGDFDTLTDLRCYSYRRHPQTGRMATLIYLTPLYQSGNAR
ncbi:MAG: multi-copper polyphenol oxidoreductase [Gammaproteobacteria bacterium]|nr:MAG: multi-copper polyphenol oxidoreductase [Gammaproteobacteria bacterium]